MSPQHLRPSPAASLGRLVRSAALARAKENLWAKTWNTGMRKGLAASLLAFWVLGFTGGLTGCLLGGTGTGTGNGIDPTMTDSENSGNVSGMRLVYRDSSGSPVAGLRFHILPATHSPRDAEPTSRLRQAQDTLVSNAKGEVPNLQFTQAGTYMVAAVQGNAVVGLDSLLVLDTSGRDTVHFTISSTQHWQGKISLESGLRVQSGWLVVRGTPYAAQVDSLGQYDLGNLSVSLVRKATLSLEDYRVAAVTVKTAILIKPGEKLPSSSYDTTAIKADSAIMGQLPALPQGADLPDTIRIASDSKSVSNGDTAVSANPSRSNTVIPVKCLPDSAHANSLCLAEGVLNYQVETKGTAMVSTVDSVGAGKDPVYLQDGRLLPVCSASPASKSSQSVVASGASGDLQILDVSSVPTCSE